MKKIVIMSFWVASFLLASCAPDETLQKKVNELESKINNLDGKIEERHFSVSRSLMDIEDRLLNEEITFDPVKKGVGYIKSNVGNFFVRCKEIKSYGKGQKITLMIGNPYGIAFKGFTINVRYGMRLPDYLPGDDPEKSKKWTAEVDKSIKSMKEKSFKRTEDLLPGKWNKVDIVLAPAKPEDVGRLTIKIFTDAVSLRDA